MKNMEQEGRGAWPSRGYGGTLRPPKYKTTKGPYYMLASEDENQIGLKTWCLRAQQQPVAQDYNAVFHGVIAIQMLCNYYGGTQLGGDGIFGPETQDAVKWSQGKAGVATDGIVGIKTMRALLRPLIKWVAIGNNIPWEPLYGILRYEGALDPGAIGYVDAEDWGLAQINTKYHPEVSFAEAFCPSFAIRFVANYIVYGLRNLDDNIRDAVAAYNLGITGTKQWIKDGRPDVWLPSWSTLERKPNAYINRILQAASQRD